MPNDKPLSASILRLRHVERCLLSKEGLHVRGVAKEFGVTDRTIRRHVRLLEEMTGNATYFDDTVNRHWYVKKSVPLFNPKLKDV